MRHLPTILIFLLTTAFIARPVYEGKSYKTASEVLQKLSDKINSCRTISYNYYRSINYFSENYHNETTGTTFLDFQSTETILGFKYQLENEQSRMIYNGAESFYLNKKDKTIKINYKPKLSDFTSLSFFVNSIVTLKKALPVLIEDKEIVKTLTDTTIDNKSFHMVSFVLHNKTMSGLGTFSAITLKRDFLYKIIVDKEAFLPLHVIQTNNVEPKDYMITSFSNITSNGNSPSEVSWYYSTYTKDYKPASEKTLVLIKQNTVAPDWRLPYVDNNDSITLSNLKDKVILLEFWIKNCGYCVAAVPKLNSLMEKYKTKKFQIIGINTYDTKEDIDNFYQRTNPIFKTAFDNMKVTHDYGVQAFPTVVLIDKKGVVLYSGNYDQEQLDKLIKNALK
ncbi:MAG TPA: TlpA disulfide reductase family protein [Chitinophagaceae bacterium]|nr:TlpA disulfide reductase family protein [Chitinophagaceae bacterium]